MQRHEIHHKQPLLRHQLRQGHAPRDGVVAHHVRLRKGHLGGEVGDAREEGGGAREALAGEGGVRVPEAEGRRLVLRVDGLVERDVRVEAREAVPPGPDL